MAFFFQGIDLIRREEFLTWQCRIRQIAMRDDGGQPTKGMQPSVWLAGGNRLIDAMNILLIPGETKESTAFFKFQVKKSNDPKDVMEKGLQFLQSTFYHDAPTFNDEMTALFSPYSDSAVMLLESEQCLLVFEQFNQTFKLVCTVRELSSEEASWQATYWHNLMFNPAVPGDARIVGFTPFWEKSNASVGG